MSRPSQVEKNRRRLLPVVARAFAELGYRRATTAELARRCMVRENILYRLWPNKKAMFVASIDYVYDQALATWQEILSASDGKGEAAMRLLKYEAEHYGESGLQRIIFAGLSETDEPEIREALRTMYSRFFRFICGQVASFRKSRNENELLDEAVSAWAIIGLGNLANLSRQLGLLSDQMRRKMFAEAGRVLLEGRTP